jgi:hypothetical protein
MRRRDFVALLGTVTTLPIAWLEAARAQQPDRMRHVGVLMAHAESDPEYQDYLTAFRGNSIVSDRRKAAISKLPLAGERSKTRSQGCAPRTSSSRCSPTSLLPKTRLLPRQCCNKRILSLRFL